MSDATNNIESISPSNDMFVTTHWSAVLAAGNRHTPNSDQALNELCAVYWYPLYAYVRRRGFSHEDAEDMTQSFFLRLLEKNPLANLSSEKGKFRAFMLVAMQHFICNEWDRASCKKRGANALHFSLDWQSAETRYQMEPVDQLSPDKLYDRAWAMALLEKVLAALSYESRCEHNQDLYEKLKSFLTMGKGEIPYSQLALDLNQTEGSIRVAVHRLRKRYRSLLREEIKNTLADPAMVDEEMRALFEAFTQ